MKFVIRLDDGRINVYLFWAFILWNPHNETRNKRIYVIICIIFFFCRVSDEEIQQSVKNFVILLFGLISTEMRSELLSKRSLTHSYKKNAVSMNVSEYVIYGHPSLDLRTSDLHLFPETNNQPLAENRPF